MKEKDLEDFVKKKKRMDLLNSKISLILPELMSRNLKLVERLKNKLKVSSFFNNIEHRNKKYFQDFIFSSDKRAKDLKTGLKINKAIKQSSKKMSLLCRQMSDDVILKNADILLKEKKLISENTEQETHIKINELINNLKTAVKTPYGIKAKPMKKIIKSLSQDEIKEAKEFIGDKIMKEEKQIQDKINKYLKKLHNSLDSEDIEEDYKEENKEENKVSNNEATNDNNNNDDEDNSFKIKKIRKKKEFNRYAENVYMKDHIKFINYTKPKPFQIKDKESANLKRIKKCLSPPTIEELANMQNENTADDDNDTTSMQNKTFLYNHNNSSIIDKNNSFNRNASMTNIRSKTRAYMDTNKINMQTTKNNKSTLDELYNIDVSGKDTLEVLNNLVDQGKYLPERMEKKLEKINSLIEVKLPYPTSYELVLNYFKNTQNLNDINDKINKNYFSFYPALNKNKTFNNFQNTNRTLPELTPNMRQKLSLIKDDIKNMKNSNLANRFMNPMFMTYLGHYTGNNKNVFNKMNNNNGNNKKLSHKNSMDNILEKRGDTVFITLKKLINDQKKINNKRKVRSCKDILIKK